MQRLQIHAYRLAVGGTAVAAAGVAVAVAVAVAAGQTVAALPAGAVAPEAGGPAEIREPWPAVVPRPAHLERQAGTWILKPKTQLVAARASQVEAGRFADALAPALDRRLEVTGGPARPGDIVFSLDGSRMDLGEEGYELLVTRDGPRIHAAGVAGLFYAGETLRQLLPDGAWRRAPVNGAPWRVPCVRIVDRPRFAWRGLLLDPARHFIAKSELFAVLDAMAMHKLNRLQLHLTDDQGWRIEIRAYPRLTARSSWRDGTLVGHLGDKTNLVSGVPHGGFYTQEDAREIVAYAAARHIVVVPEIEMPGHAGAWLAAYPELAVFPERAAGLTVRDRWGINQDVLAPRPQTLEACRRVLDEVCEVFPSPWIHIGGDEAPRDQWRASPEMQAQIRSLGLRNENELQAWFTAQLSHHLADRGRRLVGWDEILDGAALGGKPGGTGLAANAIAMSWRSWLGETGERAAARAGHDTVMAPADSTYLDHYQGPPDEEPLAIGESLSLAHVYAYDPAPDGLAEAVASHILGAQAQVWGEYVASFEAVGYMTFPRACAAAEVFWSPREPRDLAEFLPRLERHEARLQALGIPHRPLARRACLPDASGRITAPARDATIHGTGITREPDGSLGGWKDPETIAVWRLDLPRNGPYRVRVLLKPAPASTQSRLEAIVAGRVLRADLRGSAEAVDLGEIRAEIPGPRLFFLRAGGAPGPAGFATVSGLELTPGK